MTSADAVAVRELARGRAEQLLATTPWADIAPRALVLLARPPRDEWAEPLGTPALWVVLDGAEARALPAETRGALLQDGVQVLGGGPAEQQDVATVLLTADGLGRLLDGVARRSLEARWLVRHGEALHDPLRRYERAAGAAARLPADGLERATRPLFLRAATMLDTLAAVPPQRLRDTALLLIGEAAGAAARLACVLDEGSHPPVDWLLPAARETRLGRRLEAWLDDIAPAVAGDARAARWVAESGSGVLRELVSALRADFAGRDWLLHPLDQALRPGR